MPEKKYPWALSAVAFVILGLFLWGLVHSFLNLDYDWNFSFLKAYIWEQETNRPGLLLQGLWGTFYVSALAIFFGTIGGFLVGLCLLSRERVSRASAFVYVEVFRNTPVLVQLYVMYFVVGTAFNMEAEQAGVVTLSLFCAAYVAEIVRGTLSTFERGQLDAARSMGLTPLQVSWHVVMPQALRSMLPPLVGQFVTLVKDSSLVSVISIMELTKAALNMVSVSFRSFETWFVVALVYLALNTILSTAGRALERRLRRDLQQAT